MKKLSKLLSISLVFVLVLCTAPFGGMLGSDFPAVFVSAATNGSCGANLSYTLDDNGLLTISGSGNIQSRSFENNTSIKTAVINSGITGIRFDAFRGCSSMTSITLPDTLTVVEKGAFSLCTALTSITLPDGVTAVGDSAFSHCEALTSITLPDSVTDLGISVFSYCTRLTEATLPKGITSIGTQLFNGCTHLTSIIIPDGVTLIDDFAFSQCTRLAAITIPDSVIFIGGKAFDQTAWLNNKPDGLVYTNNILYLYKGDMPENTTIDIKEGTVSISDRAFADCTNLISVNFPDGLTSIGAGAFRNCSGLTSVSLPDSVTSSYSEVFSGCINLTQAYLSSGITTIGIDMFSGCKKLKSVNIPESVTTIGVRAFSDTGLTSVTIPNSVNTIAGEAFSYSGLKSVFIPASVTNIVSKAFYFSALESIVVDPANSVYDSRNDCNAIINTETNALEVGCKNTVIPDSVTKISSDAFAGCYLLEKIIIPDNVQEIQSRAFQECSFLSAVIIRNRDMNFSDRLLGKDYAPFRIFNSCDNVTIYGYKDSTAQQYAEQKSIPFVPFEDICHVPEIRNAVTATCTQDGYTGDTYCSYCGEKIADGTSIAKLAHTYSESAFESQTSTCITAGYDKYQCTKCTDVKTVIRVLEPENHEGATENRNVVTATCTQDGYTGDTYCIACGTKISDGTIIEKKTHNLGEWTVTVTVKCTENGLKKRICNNCDYFETVEIPAPGHSTSIVNAKAATQTEAGYTGDTVCEICGKVINKGAVIPVGGSLAPEQYPDFAGSEFEHRNNGNGWDFWYENQTFVNGTQFLVSEYVNAEDEALCKEHNNNHNYKIYDLKAQIGEMLVQPNGTVWIALKLPGKFDENRTNVYYVNSATDTYEKMPCFIRDGKIFFAVTHFSAYAIVDETCLHNITHLEKAKEATCIEKGYTGDEVCNYCGITIKRGKEIAEKIHVDDNKDEKCDICGTIAPFSTNAFFEFILRILIAVFRFLGFI